jgi:hypothetical protein
VFEIILMKTVFAFQEIYGIRLLPRSDALSLTSVMLVCSKWRKIVSGRRGDIRRRIRCRLEKQVIPASRRNSFWSRSFLPIHSAFAINETLINVAMTCIYFFVSRLTSTNIKTG